jgi:hypothetical protein
MGLIVDALLGGTMGYAGEGLRQDHAAQQEEIDMRKEARAIEAQRMLKGMDFGQQDKLQGQTQAHQRALQDDSQTYHSGENDKSRTFSADESEKGRTFQAGEGAKNRTFQGGQNAAGRALTERGLILSERQYQDGEGKRAVENSNVASILADSGVYVGFDAKGNAVTRPLDANSLKKIEAAKASGDFGGLSVEESAVLRGQIASAQAVARRPTEPGKRKDVNQDLAFRAGISKLQGQNLPAAKYSEELTKLTQGIYGFKDTNY